MNLNDEIVAVARELYEASGYIPGRDLDNWLAAERIVLARHAGQDFEEPEEEEDGSQGETAAQGEKAKESEETEENQESGFD